MTWVLRVITRNVIPKIYKINSEMVQIFACNTGVMVEGETLRTLGPSRLPGKVAISVPFLVPERRLQRSTPSVPGRVDPSLPGGYPTLPAARYAIGPLSHTVTTCLSRTHGRCAAQPRVQRPGTLSIERYSGTKSGTEIGR